MARPRNADGQRTRQAILDAALDLFSEKGYFGTSLRDVATAVGVRESALYNYFAGKDALRQGAGPIYAGDDIAFRVVGRNGKTPIVVPVVKVNGEWVDVEFGGGGIRKLTQ